MSASLRDAWNAPLRITSGGDLPPDYPVGPKNTLLGLPGGAWAAIALAGISFRRPIKVSDLVLLGLFLTVWE